MTSRPETTPGSSREISEDDLILHYYGESADPRAIALAARRAPHRLPVVAKGRARGQSATGRSRSRSTMQRKPSASPWSARNWWTSCGAT